MNWRMIITFVLGPLVADAELVWLPDPEPQAVFAAEPQPVKAIIRNPGGSRVQRPIHARLFQTGSETMAPVGKPWFWKELVVLPGQTVMEEIEVKFPKVEVAAMFRLFWLDDRGETLAYTDVRAHPGGLLQPLTRLAGDHPMGVFDPEDRLKPLLRTGGIEFDELTGDGHPAAFKGRLVVVAPVGDARQLPERFARDLCAVARERGLALVWFQSPDQRQYDEPPVAHPLVMGKGRAMVAPASLLADLASSPQAQLHLVWLTGLAVHGPKDEFSFAIARSTTNQPPTK